MVNFFKKKKIDTASVTLQSSTADENTKEININVLGDSSKFAQTSPFTSKEIKRIQKRFFNYMCKQSCLLDVDIMLRMPELRMNPFVERVLRVINPTIVNYIDFDSYLSLLSKFSVKTNVQEKRRVVFKVFDIDNDGVISNKDLSRMLEHSMNMNLALVEIERLTQRILNSHGNPDATLGLRYEEFDKIIHEDEVQSYLTIQF